MRRRSEANETNKVRLAPQLHPRRILVGREGRVATAGHVLEDGTRVVDHRSPRRHDRHHRRSCRAEGLSPPT